MVEGLAGAVLRGAVERWSRHRHRRQRRHLRQHPHLLCTQTRGHAQPPHGKNKPLEKSMRTVAWRSERHLVRTGEQHFRV